MNQQLLTKVKIDKLIANDQMRYFPSTRFMGSKNKLLEFIWENTKDLQFTTVLDAFSGSGCVGYMFKTKGKAVTSNDVLQYSFNIANALISNNDTQLEDSDISKLLNSPVKTDGFIRNTFKNLYFTEAENLFLEEVAYRIPLLNNEYKKSLALAALCRACIKKRPRGIFTYVGDRYNDGRKDLRTNLDQHFIEAIGSCNKAIFDNHQNNFSFCGDIFNLNNRNFDLIYIDPPYYSTRSDNDYLRRYHFVEGLCSYWKDVEIQHSTKTKKIKKYFTKFGSKNSVYSAFHKLFNMFPKSIFVISYSSNSLPTKDEMVSILGHYRSNVEVKEMDYKYSFGNHGHKIGDNRNDVKEYLFIAK